MYAECHEMLKKLPRDFSLCWAAALLLAAIAKPVFNDLYFISNQVVVSIRLMNDFV